MHDDDHDTAQKHVTLIPTDRIRILNPRVRNRRNFEEMVENIAKIGLKRPITVAQRVGTDPAEYDLVCGQGRLEAFMELQQDAIPAIIIDADESHCLVMSLVENCAPRKLDTDISYDLQFADLQHGGDQRCRNANNMRPSSKRRWRWKP